MTDTVPDGPTDPRLTVVAEDEESTTIVPQPGYVVPPMPSAPSAPPAAPEPPGGRVYSTGERSHHSDPPEAAGRGRTTVADEVVDRVVEKIVSLVADQVAGARGVHAGGADDAAGPVSVQLDGDQAVIDITLQVEFGHPLHEVVENVRGAVISQVERLLGLTVTEVNILVAEVTFDPAP
ncbi:MAG: Asp23/Gls24 family envelope stress response protein [Micromonosporaceae bacterium]|nr:Asp23/Gls24 family envelope stress response protein [Micromonosporaceae bacterium]